MAKTKVSLGGGKLGAPPPAEPPKREDVPPGQYLAMVLTVKEGFTQGKTKLNKITVPFQILHEIRSDGSTSEKFKGRQVWQDYIIDNDDSVDENFNSLRLYQLKMMLLATETPHDDDGFDPDEIGTKNNKVKIWITHRQSTKVENGVQSTKVFTNVEKIDTGKDVNPDSLV